MSSASDDDPVMRSSTERHDRVGADLDWFIILASASSIFFGFLLNIAVNPPSYFKLFEDVILLAALYAVTVATAMFIMPLIYHINSSRQFFVDRFIFRTKQYALIGIICVMLAMYLGLGLLLTSKLPIQFAFSLASLPFIVIILFRFFKRTV
jgi:Family of unknown function (DUF6328)